MNIEESIDNVKFIIGDLKASNYNQTFIQAIEALLTAYEKEKEERKRIGKLYYEANENCIKYEKELEKEKEKNKDAIDFINERKKTVNKDMAEGTKLQVGTFMWQVDELLEILKEE